MYFILFYISVIHILVYFKVVCDLVITWKTIRLIVYSPVSANLAYINFVISTWSVPLCVLLNVTVVSFFSENCK